MNEGDLAPAFNDRQSSCRISRYLVVITASLGRDNNYAVGTSHTVRCCFWTLEDPDGRDVMRVDVKNVVWPRFRGKSVQNVEWLIAGHDTGCTPDSYGYASPLLEDFNARYSTLEQLVNRSGGRILNVLASHRIEGVIPPTFLRSRTFR